MNTNVKILICAILVIALVGISYAGTSTAPGQLKKHTPTPTPTETIIPTIVPTTIPTTNPPPTPTISPSDGKWEKQGTVIVPMWGDTIVEPTVLYEGNPQILLEATTVFKMWYRESGYSDSQYIAKINYAESSDGISWVQYPTNPIVTISSGRLWCPFIIRYNETTLFMYVSEGDGYKEDRYYSTDGISWTLDKSGTLTGLLFGNIFVWLESPTDWRALSERSYTGGATWETHYLISTDGKVWIDNGISVHNSGGSVGGSDVHKIGSKYYVWYHKAISGNLPTDIWRAESNDGKTWTNDTKVFWRTGVSEGEGLTQSQVADVSILEYNGKTYMWYDQVKTQSYATLGFAINDLPLSELVKTSEGVAL